jgi:hypothetical protein
MVPRRAWRNSGHGQKSSVLRFKKNREETTTMMVIVAYCWKKLRNWQIVGLIKVALFLQSIGWLLEGRTVQ